MERQPSLRQLRCFLAAVETGSIGRAADEIALSQPAVSDAIARLEDAFGVPLLVRRIGGSAASADGVLLARRVRRLFAQLDQGLCTLQADRTLRLKSLVMLRMVHLRAHIAVAEHGTFARAAAHLGLSDAALHRSARALETLIGRDLYRRGADGIGSNAGAKILARHMRLALRELMQAHDEIGRRTAGAPARISMGILPLMPKRWVAGVIARTKAEHPEAGIALREGRYADLLQELHWGAIDVIVGALPPQAAAPDIVEEPLFADPYVLVVRKGHPLADVHTVTRTMLTEHDWVVPSHHLPRRAAIERFFSTLPARPRIWLDTSSPGTMMAVLAETDCITLISRTQWLMDGPADLVVLPVDGFDAGRTVGITRRHDWLPTAVQDRFLRALRESAPLAEAGAETVTG